MMKLYSILSIILFGFTSITAWSQQVDTSKNEDGILAQFNELLEKSSNYQHYKVIPKSKMIEFKDNVLDSLSEQKKVISEKIQMIEASNDKIEEFKQKIQKLEEEYKAFKEERETMSFFGFFMDKTTYSVVMWLLVVAFLGLSGWFYFQFSKSNIVTKESVKRLKEVEKEYEEHRRTALERDQKIRRQLQDEINKNRGV